VSSPPPPPSGAPTPPSPPVGLPPSPSPAVPPPGSGAGSLLRRWWARFRATPVVVQLIAWVLVWPLVGALAIVGRDRSRTRYALATAVLVVGAASWVPVLAGAGQPAAVEVTATDEDEAASDVDATDGAGAPVAAGALDADRLASAEAREAAARAAADVEAKAAEEARRAAAATWTVFHVVDGDTVDVRWGDGTEERVRIIGIDTPERGGCGSGEATSAMAQLVDGEQVDLVAGARDDRDRYGRILRYVDVGGVDAGLTLIEQGLAIARYDSRDGYGRHPREDAYVAADRATEHLCAVAAPAPAPSSAPPPSSTSSGPGTGPGGAWKNCTEARAHGAAPVHRGDPGYGSHLDRDDDGIGCE
jgi:micrococcal nuclease